MPVIDFPSFLGSDYIAQSVNTARSELVNWYIERTESATDQSPFPVRLQPTPGLSTFVSSLQSPIRGVFAQDGRAFAAGGTKIYELQGDGTADVIGMVISDDQPVTFVTNGHGGHQLIITSAGNGYIFDLVSGTFVQIGSGFPANAVMADFIDGYFVVMQATTSRFFLSALENGLSWSPSDVGAVSSSSDNLIAMRVMSRNIWLFGSLRTEIWANQGGTFPFAPIQPILEFGIASPWSLAEADGSLCFVAQTQNGSAMVLQSSGYGFKRISTHNEELILTGLPDLWNVRAYSYQELGHTFYVLCPNTGPAMVYDLATGLWHRRGVWNAGQHTYLPLKQWCHMYAFGKHLVGDTDAGTIYEQSLAFGMDAGTGIRRLRTAPHVNQAQQWLFGSQVSLGVETGLSAGFTTPEDVFFPQSLLLSYSKDGGHTFTEPRAASAGMLGEYSKLVTWHQTPGRFHDLVLRVEAMSSLPVRINSCQLRVEAGRLNR